MATFLPKLSERSGRLRKLLKQNEAWYWKNEQEVDFRKIKYMLIQKIPMLHIRRESSSLYRPPRFEAIIRTNRRNKQYSARLTRWLSRLSHFDIAIQLLAGINSKFTNYLSRNPVGRVAPEVNYDEENVINILAEQAD